MGGIIYNPDPPRPTVIPSVDPDGTLNLEFEDGSAAHSHPTGRCWMTSPARPDA